MQLEQYYSELVDKLDAWLSKMAAMLPNFLLALVILIFTFVAAKITRNIMERVLKRISENPSVNRILAGVIYGIVISVGIFFVLSILDLDKALTSLLAGAGIIGLGLSFAFQEIAANFVSGIFIAFTKPYHLGDIIKINDFYGEVIMINLRTTHVMTFQGLEVLIPNKEMFTSSFTNLTTTPKRRIDLECGVSYGEDLRNVTRVATDALEKVENRIQDMPVDIFFQSFGNSSIDFVAHIWVEYPGMKTFLKARHQAVILLKEAFDQNGITIPFPIRTLDFGIKGGTRLNEVLAQSEKTQS